MSKMSRVRLWLSILTCEGLFATLRERVQWAPPPPDYPGADASQGQPPALPRYHDYAGAMHVHSTYSDGLGSVAEVAAAADRAGLDFVALCDHSNLDAITHGEDGWRGRTLVLIGTEITTDQGHLLAMDVPPDLLPLPNEAEQVQRAIQDSGGFGFIALPCDLKDHWRDFAARRSGIGLEVFNLSAIARAKISVPGFLLAWATYRSARPQRAFHWVAARPTRELRLWDALTAARAAGGGGPTRVVGIGSLDAHAVMKVARRKYPIPTYEELFRTLRTHVLTTQALSGGGAPARPTPPDARADQALVHAALAAGHCYIAYDNYGDSSGFVFEAVAAHGPAALMGDAVPLPPRTEAGQTPSVTLTARAPRTRTLIHLYKDGRRVAAARGGRLDYAVTEPGAYRVEVYLYRRRLGRLCLGVKPWVFSNPIYVQPSVVPSARAAAGKNPRQFSES